MNVVVRMRTRERDVANDAVALLARRGYREIEELVQNGPKPPRRFAVGQEDGTYTISWTEPNIESAARAAERMER